MAPPSDSSSHRRRWIVITGCLSLLLLLYLTLTTKSTSIHSHRLPIPQISAQFGPLPPPRPPAISPQLTKPPNVKIIGLVFYGRKSRVEILKCYLERNLVDNGGWLDEIHWVLNTGNKKDLAYLDEVLLSSERYKKIDLSDEGIGFEGYAHAWGHLQRGSLYVKIDDDVVYFADDTVPRIVTLKLSNPSYLLVSANIINSPLMGWVHYHMGAQHPYFPELIEPPTTVSLLSSKSIPWRPSSHPLWTGPDEYYVPLDLEPPYSGHRWLRLANDSDIHRTPMAETEYRTWGTALKSWPIAAQTHYSFLENLELDQLDLYKSSRPWLTDYKRLSINFMTLWADDVLDNLPMDTVDEEWLTINLPRGLGKSVAVEMEALAAHFTFGTQGGVGKTDLLARYKGYADEVVCGK